MADVEIVSKSRCFGGEVRFLRHASRSTRCDMVFSVFVPPQAADGPVTGSSPPSCRITSRTTPRL